MRRYLLLMLLPILILVGCSAPAPTEAALSSPQPSAIPTPAEPSGTVIKQEASDLVLSHPNFYWSLRIPGDWVITYDSGYQVMANSPDQAISLRLQAQRWKSPDKRLPDARAYVDHWKNFELGDVFPLYANGTQLSETEISPDKYGGPYLRYEFEYSKKQVHYLQVYASAGGPSSAVLTVWTAHDKFEEVRSVMETILESFALTEEVQ